MIDRVQKKTAEMGCRELQRSRPVLSSAITEEGQLGRPASVDE